MKCQLCDKEMDLPFRCSYCEGYFCIDHKLPENHQCPELPKLKSFPHPMESKGVWEPETESKQEPEKPKQKPKTPLLAFCIILILVGATAAYTSYTFGYNIGSDFAYNKGHDEGHNVGYDEGYVNGNLSGYQNGYATGYNSGNLTGYQGGYENGYEIGFGSGNSEGYEKGYNVGYDEGYVNGNLNGYQEGYGTGYVQGVTDGAGRGYNIRDPTYEEMINFVAADKTDQNQYTQNYTCWNFAGDVKNNAFKAGYRCGFVYIEFPDSAHGIVAFNTTNHGLIYIEPQSDDIVTLTIGQPYWDRTKYEPSYDDTIVRFGIIW